MTITEKVAYLKGLVAGMNLDKTTNEGKLFTSILDTLEDLALSMADAEERLDVLDEDLADVEDLIYEDFDEDDGFYDDECTGNCDGCDGCDDFDVDDGGVYEFECPNCHETVFFDESIFDDDEEFELECPACGAKLDSVFEDADDEDLPETDD